MNEEYKEFLSINLDDLLHAYSASRLEDKMEFSQFCKSVFYEWMNEFSPNIETTNKSSPYGASGTPQ